MKDGLMKEFDPEKDGDRKTWFIRQLMDARQAKKDKIAKSRDHDQLNLAKQL